MRFGQTALAAAFSLALLGTALADSECAPVAGDFVTDLYFGAECPDAVPQCFHAVLRGDIDAPAWSVIRGATPAPTVDAPTRTLFDMSHTVFEEDGTIVTADDLYVDAQPVGASPFTSVIHFVSGTGAFGGVAGAIATVGWYDFVAGHGEGRYQGELCG